VNLPESFGGGGRGVLELAIVAEELAAAGCPPLLLVVSRAICGSILTRIATREQQERWLPGIATGREKMAFAITEADAGSNSHALSVAASWAGDSYHLRGTKQFI
jgi:alkylation response protein AidB-like acyl-CoA dehydrogenase